MRTSPPPVRAARGYGGGGGCGRTPVRSIGDRAQVSIGSEIGKLLANR